VKRVVLRRPENKAGGASQQRRGHPGLEHSHSAKRVDVRLTNRQRLRSRSHLPQSSEEAAQSE
jgi:hypothetical protein